MRIDENDAHAVVTIYYTSVHVIPKSNQPTKADQNSSQTG